jgi:hypothetical protein
MSDDRTLHERFASLRGEDGARTPRFERVLLRTRSTQRYGAWAIGATAAILVAAIGVFVYRASLVPSRPPSAAPMLASWHAPTDFLLKTPGIDLLRAVPRIGEPSAGVRRLTPGLYDTMPPSRVGQEPHS